jgi:hypothetical protein
MPDLDYSEDDREQIMLVYYGTASLKGLVAIDFCSASAPSGWIIAMTSVESFVSVCLARLKRLGGTPYPRDPSPQWTTITKRTTPKLARRGLLPST